MRGFTTLSFIAVLAANSACFDPEGVIFGPHSSSTVTESGPDSEGPRPNGATSDGTVNDSTTDAMTSSGSTGWSSSGCDGGCGPSTTGDNPTGDVWTGSTSCDAGCGLPACGDGHVDPPEECDDGNTEMNDGCTNNCQRSRLVFVTAATYTGGLGSPEAADDACQTAAEDALLLGTFKAWISEGGDSPWGRFDITYTGMYVRTDGEIVVAGGWPDLTDGSLAIPIDRDEFGAEVIVNTYAWTGTNEQGGPTEPNCSGWLALENMVYGVAGSCKSVDQAWTNADLLPCGTGYRLYCFADISS